MSRYVPSIATGQSVFLRDGLEVKADFSGVKAGGHVLKIGLCHPNVAGEDLIGARHDMTYFGSAAQLLKIVQAVAALLLEVEMDAHPERAEAMAAVIANNHAEDRHQLKEEVGI